MKFNIETCGHDEEEEETAVWVVAGTHADDPHPHILGVYAEEEQADDLMDRCSDPGRAPHVDAWDKARKVVQNDE